jgi:UDP-N-acetylbacillosamine N-acetyltransferase
MRPKILIWGASGHALVVADILRVRGEYEIWGLLDDSNPPRGSSHIYGLPILGGADCLDELKRTGIAHLICGIGNCSARLRLASAAKEKGFQLGIAAHPHAVIAENAEVGCGSVIAAGAVVNPGAKVGENVIINTCASVDHECSIGDGVHLGPGVHLGGLVKIEEGAWIGIGATICDRIRIGSHSIIGAGSVVTKDVPPGVVAYGVPAKVIRSVPDQKI